MAEEERYLPEVDWNGFEWVVDLYKSPCFTTNESYKPATSTDFGRNGFTASLTDWHEMLQVTAPDAHCGLVYVRGRFPNAAGAILARSQRRVYQGSKDLFGARAMKPRRHSELELGEKKAQGWINFRWPYTHYELMRDNEAVGTYEQISFVRNGVVVQVIRIKSGHGSSLSDSGPDEEPEKQTLSIRTGGRIRFGCACCSNETTPAPDAYRLYASEGDKTRLNCCSIKYRKRLEMRFVLNGSPQEFDTDRCPSVDQRTETVDTSSVHQVDLSAGEPTYIISTLALRDLEDVSDPVNGGLFRDLTNYLGVVRSSRNMTDRLWTALCSTNYEDVEAKEMSAVGRSVERIIGVAAIPIMQSNHPHDKNMQETALVQNIMMPQFVDVQSTFYQIRLLVKAYNFIDTRKLEPDILEHIRALDDIRHSYLEMLRGFLKPALTWLINTDLRKNRLLPAVSSRGTKKQFPSVERLEQCAKNRVEMSHDQTYNRSCYATLAVWYVMRYCPEAINTEFRVSVLLPKLPTAYLTVQDRAMRDKAPSAKNDVLQWYHLGCIYLICHQTFQLDEKGNPQNAFALTEELDQQQILQVHHRFQKFAARLKASHGDFYSSKHEELDRVVLLGEELGLEEVNDNNSSFNQVRIKAQQTRDRIVQRKRTTRFNPSPGNARHFNHAGNGPWELICANHEIYLQIAEETSITSARDRVLTFLTTDYSFMTSWDFADSNWIAKWWDMETASLVCSTLLRLKEEGKLRSPQARNLRILSNRHAHVPEAEGVPGDDEMGIALGDLRVMGKDPLDTILQLRQLLAQDLLKTDESIRPFEWLQRRPNQEHHPTWWIESLDDTPEVYRAKQDKNVPLRKDLMGYFRYRKRMEIVREAVYTARNIHEKLSPIDVQYLSCFDIRFTNKHGHQVEYVRLAQQPQHGEPRRNDQIHAHRARLFKRLNDSLVDLDIRHRILFASKCTPALVGAAVYLWHPESLDNVDSYFGTTSRFTEGGEGMSWNTSINISHWRLLLEQGTISDDMPFQEQRSKGDFPPTTIALLGATKKQLKSRILLRGGAILEERSSSIVFTGDMTGQLWICSIFSCLLESEELHTTIQTSVRKILQKFVNQQAVARSLVFLTLLGHLCEKLAAEYDLVLKHLDEIVGLGEEVLLQGIDWGKSQTLDKLKKMLWGLEALRAFDERLSASLMQIQRAKETMERYGAKNAPYLHIDLVQEYQQVIEEFTKRNDILHDVDSKMKVKIKQVTGLRDGISTVTNVEDNQTTLRNAEITVRQGNNIRTLTYITIAYLPLGFVTGLFSVSHAPFMDAAGDVHFAILTAVFVTVTYAGALFLQNIIDQISDVVRHWSTGRMNGLPTSHVEDSDSSSKPRASWVSTFLGTKGRHSHDVIEMNGR